MYLKNKNGKEHLGLTHDESLGETFSEERYPF